jgi:hypothetical protein
MSRIVPGVLVSGIMLGRRCHPHFLALAWV